MNKEEFIQYINKELAFSIEDINPDDEEMMSIYEQQLLEHINTTKNYVDSNRDCISIPCLEQHISFVKEVYSALEFIKKFEQKKINERNNKLKEFDIVYEELQDLILK